MTRAETVFREKAKKSRLKDAAYVIAPIFVIALLTVMIASPAKVGTGISESLTRCIKSLIPALFPISVLSSLLVSLGGGEFLSKLLGAPVSLLFGVSKNVSGAIIVGLLCGFPIGSSLCHTLYSSGYISKDEFESAVAFSSVPSPAFILNAVGDAMLGDRRLGAVLLLCVMLSNTVTAQLFRFGAKKPEPIRAVTNIQKRSDLGTAVSKALSDSAIAMLNVCACVVFFSALTSVIPEGTPITLRILASGILEFSQGCANAVKTCGMSAFPVCAAFLSFCGLSVHFQIISVCKSCIRYRKYFLAIIIRSLLSFIFAYTVKVLLFDI